MDTILEAAAQIFREHGPAKATTNRIAERAGVSVGSLYQYFPNKEALLVALMERHMAEAELAIANAMKEAGGAEPRALVSALIGAALDLHLEDTELHRILFEEAPRPARVRETFEKGEARMRGALHMLFERFPRSVCHDPARSAYIAVPLIENMVHRYATARQRVMPPAAFREHLTELVMHELQIS